MSIARAVKIITLLNVINVIIPIIYDSVLIRIVNQHNLHKSKNCDNRVRKLQFEDQAIYF